MSGIVVYADFKRHMFIPYNAKIADITHADILKHTLTLANAAGTGAIAGETRKIIMIIAAAVRQVGAGDFLFYSNEGAALLYSQNNSVSHNIVVANGLQRLQYSLSVANDDFDLYCHGYVVET